MILDLFAGPGGWSEGLHRMGLQDVGIEWDEAACQTRVAAGHATIRADVANYPRSVFKDKLSGMIASPPCQAFSRAGKRLGLNDVRGQLVYQVVEWADELRPPWIACEQVPSVLPIWKAFADPLRDMGYSVWYGELNAMDYGVPQDRKRAILMAKLDGQVNVPAATHGDSPEHDMFGSTLLPVVTMAGALGWDGKVGFPRRDDTGTSEDEYRERDWRSTDRPSQTVTEKARSWTRKLNTGRDWEAGTPRSEAQTRDTDQPAPTLAGQAVSWVWQDGDEVELVPGSFADGRENGNRRTYDPETEPAPTLHFGHDAAGWRWRHKSADPDQEPPDWPLERPATTVVTRGLVADPGQNTNRDNNATKTRNDGYRVEAWEAGVLQSFHPRYPWQGTKTKQFQQIGNAVPPLLAEAILRELID